MHNLADQNDSDFLLSENENNDDENIDDIPTDFALGKSFREFLAQELPLKVLNNVSQVLWKYANKRFGCSL